MNKCIVWILIISIIALALGCTTPRAYEGGAAGAAFGGIAGAMLDNKNPWRGGVKGALLGGALGASLTEISARAARDAAVQNRPVKYISHDQRSMYVAEPIGNINGETNCRKVRERVVEDGILIKDHVKEVCTGNITERRY